MLQTESLASLLQKENNCMHKLTDTRYALVRAILLRVLLLVHSSVTVGVVVSLQKEPGLVALLLLPLLTETVYTLVKRKDRENKWFSPCLLAYLCAVLPLFWLVELHKLHEFTNIVSNVTTEHTYFHELTEPGTLEYTDVWVALMEQTLHSVLVIGRWLLPLGSHLNRQHLMVLIGIAADNMELFEIYDETDVRKSHCLTYFFMGVWSLAFLLFTVDLNAVRSLGKMPAALHESPEGPQQRIRVRQRKASTWTLQELFFATDIWALAFSVLVQDGPAALVRVFAIMNYTVLNCSSAFFLCKNLIVASLLIYRLTVVFLIKRGKLDAWDDEDDDDDDYSVTEVSEVSVDSRGRSQGLLPKRGKPKDRIGMMHLGHDVMSSDT
nr:hypothetical protein BaRGS_023361 [Batillaria attramentaria]